MFSNLTRSPYKGRFFGNSVQTVAVKIYSYTKSGKAQAARVRKSVKSVAMGSVEKREIGRLLNRPARRKA